MKYLPLRNLLHWIAIVILVVLSVNTYAQDSSGQKLTTLNTTQLNPSNWLQQSDNSILLFEGRLLTGIDTAFMEENYVRLIKDLELILNDFISHGDVIGDIIEIEGSRGRVTDIGIRATKVDTADGAEFIVPNGEMISKVLKNWTLTSRTFKIDTSFCVDHSNNANMITELVEEVLKESDFILPFPKPKVYLQEIAPQFMQFGLSCWISNITESGRLKSEILKKIHTRMEEAGVKYPKKG